MIITALAPQKRRPNRVSVFIDGVFVFGMEAADAERCGLTEGAVISQERLDVLLNEVVFNRARDTALRYLSFRPRTLRETYKRLREDDYPSSVIKRVLVLMVKCRYINDREYAKNYIETRLRAHYGVFRIKLELKTRGVSADTIEKVLSQVSFDETAVILNFLQRGRRSFNAGVLRRRGFSNHSIKEAFRHLQNNGDVLNE